MTLNCRWMSVNALDAQEGNNLKQNNSKKKKKKGKSFTTRLKVKERRKGSEGSRCSAAFWHYYRHFLSSCGQAFTNLRTELITQLTLIWPAGSIIYSCSTLFLHGKSFHRELIKLPNQMITSCDSTANIVFLSSESVSMSIHVITAKIWSLRPQRQF